MAITLWDLASADPARRFSPYCWRIRYALLYKGLEFDTIPWCFTDKDRIAFSDQGKVPVIVDGGRTVCDSWAIAEYLDEAYPDRPTLLGGALAKAHARFVTDWVEAVVHAGLLQLVVADIWAHVHPNDRAYFRATREKAFGRPLEAVQADREAKLPAFHKSLEPLRRAVARQPFIGGGEPVWGDFAAFGAFQWARCTSPFHLLDPADPIHAWRGRMLDSFGGEGRRAVGYPE